MMLNIIEGLAVHLAAIATIVCSIIGLLWYVGTAENRKTKVVKHDDV